ncbi:MAG: DUF3500 domain-containing protein [Pseudomonadota bacterium]
MTLDRRSLLAGGAALAAAGLTHGPAAAQTAPGIQVLHHARRWVDELPSAQRATALFDWNDPLRARWNYFGARAKPGLRLEQLGVRDHERALTLLARLLGPEGMEKFDRVRLLQEVLRERGSGPADRNADRFSFALFGLPAEDRPWGLRVEGHHLSLSFTMIGDQVVSTTPSSFSANPNAVRGGRHDGLVALTVEHAGAARLRRDLSPENAARATIAAQPYRNILTTAVREGRLFGTRPEGVALGDLHPAQRDLAMRIVGAYTSDHLVAPLAAAEAARIADADPEAIHLGWAGGSEVGQQMYYRLHGPTFVIELATNPPEPDHLHTIRHDPASHLGRHAVEA